MKNRINIYYNNIIRSVLITKLNVDNIYKLPQVSKIIINAYYTNMLNLEDFDMIKSMLLLELISMQKTKFKNLKTIYKSKKQLLIISFISILRRYYMYNLIDFLINDIYIMIK